MRSPWPTAAVELPVAAVRGSLRSLRQLNRTLGRAGSDDLMMKRWLKFLTSFIKRDWELTDYPIRLREQSGRPQWSTGRLKPIPWTAMIDGWLLAGHGGTRESALQDLRRAFERYRASGKALPRPGASVPPQFANTSRMDRLEGIAREFFPKVLEMDYDDCLVTDESSLWDFHVEESNEVFNDRVRARFGVDVSDLTHAKLCEILERIQARRPA